MKIKTVKFLGEWLFSYFGALIFFGLGVYLNQMSFWWFLLIIMGCWMFDVAYWFKYEYGLEKIYIETVICSAIKIDDLIIRGHRHCDCYRNLFNRPKYKGNPNCLEFCEDGFITSTNRFVGRKEAREIQDRSGIKSVDKDGYRGDILYSEDLY